MFKIINKNLIRLGLLLTEISVKIFCLLSFISKQCESFTFENQSKYISQLRQCLSSIHSIFYTKRFLHCLCDNLRSKLMSFNFQLQTL